VSIYLDNNATTPLHPEVIKEITDFLTLYGNPGSLHEQGRAVKFRIDQAREDIASFFGCKVEELIFTSSASEANNMVLKSVLFQKFDFKPHVIVSAIEHPCIFNTAEFLQEQGVEVSYLPVNTEGIINSEELKTIIKKETILVSIMHANNEIGTLQPLGEIGRICNERGVYFHSDMVQSAAKIHFDLGHLPVDSASFSAHKMYAPKGIGILVHQQKSEKR
jgi:cysteine desulfurase